jgi:hypothetical protein
VGAVVVVVVVVAVVATTASVWNPLLYVYVLYIHTVMLFTAPKKITAALTHFALHLFPV